jgi:hypothetical protein
MVQIPDSVRPYVTAVVKFHFWILAAIAPLILLPLLFVAQAGISGRIEAQRGKIKGAIDSIKAVTSKSPHPNERWSEKIGERAGEIDEETFQAWSRLWETQQPIRQWPESLGKDFVKAVTTLKPDGSLRRSLLERYQNGIRSVVRQLPGRMEADELMSDAASAGGGPAGARVGNDPVSAEAKPPSLLQWNSADQQSLFNSFDWVDPPSTTQVVLAQEELWMYGVLCDVVRQVNAEPVGPDPKVVVTPANIAIPLVQQLKVGYPAAEDDPGGQNAKRIVQIKQTEQAGGGFDGGMPPPSMMMEGQAAGRPSHPRFGGGGRGMPPGMPPGFPGQDEAQAVPADDALRSWVYVDLDGKPLTAADLAAAPTSSILRLMPFLIECTIDQRALDSMLVALTSAPVPIDVRQVRINAGGTAGAGQVEPGRFAPPGPAAASGDRQRLHDIAVEMRGTLAIIMPPDKTLIQPAAPAEPAE